MRWVAVNENLKQLDPMDKLFIFANISINNNLKDIIHANHSLFILFSWSVDLIIL